MKIKYLLMGIIVGCLCACSSGAKKTYYEIPKSEIVEPTQTPTPPPTAIPADNQAPIYTEAPVDIPAPTANDDYLFPSDTVLITTSDLDVRTRDEIALIRNEIYARHGYVFSTKKYSDYFCKKSWYVPNASYDDSLLNSVEYANKTTIAEYEKAKGWR